MIFWIGAGLAAMYLLKNKNGGSPPGGDGSGGSSSGSSNSSNLTNAVKKAMIATQKVNKATVVSKR